MTEHQAAADHNAWFRREVQAGIDAANAGTVIPAEEAEAEADAVAWRRKRKRPLPAVPQTANPAWQSQIGRGRCGTW